jgi:uncharacterized protein YbaA (DUF1428 family)
MAYVDGFLLVVPTKKVAAYKKIASAAGKVWLKHGALEYRECVGEDIEGMPGMGTSFGKRVQLKKGEKIVFSWIVYKSRKHRDAVNKKVMADPYMIGMMDQKKNPMPFDLKRMSYAGFDVLVDLAK